MSSLSTDSGTPRPENFHIENYRSQNWTTKHYRNGVQTSEQSGLSLPSDVEVDIYHGRDLPDFHKRKNQGELLPFTNYLKCTQSLIARGRFDMTSWTTGGWTYSNKRFTQGPKQDVFMTFNGLDGRPFYTGGILTQMHKLITDRGIDLYHPVQIVAAKVYNRGFDALTWAAELHKTAKMIKSALTSFAHLVEDYSNWLDHYFYQSSAKRLTDTTFSSWLQGRYGWRILSYEIKDINNAIARLSEREKTRSKGIEEQNYEWSVDNTRLSSAATWDATWSDISVCNLSLRGNIVTDFVPSNVTLNPLLTAWELVPWSFVFDWLFNVGRSISALSLVALSGQYTSSYAYKLNVTRTGRLTLVPKLGAVYDAFQEVDQSIELLIRKPVTVPILPFYDNQVDNDKLKQLDLLALGYQVGSLIFRVITQKYGKFLAQFVVK